MTEDKQKKLNTHILDWKVSGVTYYYVKDGKPVMSATKCTAKQFAFKVGFMLQRKANIMEGELKFSIESKTTRYHVALIKTKLENGLFTNKIELLDIEHLV